jgi:putative ABC transport system substrate-binding protein
MGENLQSSLRQPTRRTVLRLGAGLTLMPVVAWAQEAGRTYRLTSLSLLPEGGPQFVEVLQELARAGFVEGRNLVVDRRGLGAKPERLQETAALLVADKPDVILAGGEPVIRAAMKATTTIPILGACDDCVGNGLIASLAHPGRNFTGVSILGAELDGKRQQLLTEMVPGIRRLAALADPASAGPERLAELKKGAEAQGVELAVFDATKAADIGPAIDKAHASGAQALNVLASVTFHLNHRAIFEQVAAAKLPAMFQWPEYVEEGALAGYGPRLVTLYRRQIGRQLVKVLRGTKPADIPAEQPTDIELAVNLQTAERLGLVVPESFVARADQVIR